MGENIRDFGIVSPSEDERKHNEQVGKWIEQGMKEGIAAMTDGYISPIESVYLGMQTKIENDCLEVVHKYGFNVDKEELAKALNYDREQYRKGFEDAVRRYARPIFTCEGCIYENNNSRFTPCMMCERRTRPDYYQLRQDDEDDLNED